MIIVDSRKGGYITQNCFTCKAHLDIGLSEIPLAKCSECENELEKVYKRNYAYRCNTCDWEREIYTLVPHYSEFFDYDAHTIDHPPKPRELIDLTKLKIGIANKK
jgi:hypothetical protein